MVKKIDNLEQPNSKFYFYLIKLDRFFDEKFNYPLFFFVAEVYVAVEIKSCGSYLEVAQTRCSDLTTNPVWEEVIIFEI